MAPFTNLLQIEEQRGVIKTAIIKLNEELEKVCEMI